MLGYITCLALDIFSLLLTREEKLMGSNVFTWFWKTRKFLKFEELIAKVKRLGAPQLLSLFPHLYVFAAAFRVKIEQ